MKHVKQLESFLNEGAFHVALYKARNEGAKEFEFKGKMYPVKEKKLDEGYEVHYSDGVRASQKFADKGKAIAFAKDKIKSGKGLQDIAVYNASSGFHSTADDKYLVAWWGNGSYWDNISKNDDEVKAKKIEESKLNEDWGSSDQATMNRAIHKDMGNPSRFPSPFDDKLRSAAADAVDFWWDEWPEYKRDREGLIDDAIRAYYRSYFPKEFAGFTKMFSESAVNEKEALIFDILGADLQKVGDSISDLLQKTTDQKWVAALKGIQTAWNNLEDKISKADQKLGVINEGTLSKSEANHLAHKMLNYAVDNGMIPASKKTKEHVDSMTDSLFNAKLDLKKDPRGAAHKILNGLVDRGLIPVSKKTEDHVSTLADKLKNVELNEAMVQVAGHNKPSGARVLATVIIDHLEDQNFLKLDNTRLKNQLLMDLTELIMNSTF